MAQASQKSWHDKIAASRGPGWKKNMLAGRRDAFLHPSTMRLIRMQKNIHQSVVAKEIDVSNSTYCAIERGKRLVKKDVATTIAEKLKTQVNKIFKAHSKEKFIAIIQKHAL